MDPSSNEDLIDSSGHTTMKLALLGSMEAGWSEVKRQAASPEGSHGDIKGKTRQRCLVYRDRIMCEHGAC